MRKVACLLCLLVTWLFGAGASGRTLDPALARAARLLAENRIEEAEEALRPLQSAHASDPLYLSLLGDTLFQLGRYTEAQKNLHAASGHLSGTELSEVRTLSDLAAATAEVTRGFVEEKSSSGHFVFHYRKGKDAVLIPYASEALERAFAAFLQDFAAFDKTAFPMRPVRVEIYEEIADLARVSTLTLHEIETSGTIALCKWNRLMIVSPKALLRGYPWLDTLTHEYTHFVLSRLGRGQVPLWFHEGLSKFMEKRWRGVPGGGLSPALEQLLASAVAQKRLIPFSRMSPSLAKLPSQQDAALAFAEVYTFVEFLHGKAGFPGLSAFIHALGQGQTEPKALRQAYSASFAELDEAWQKTLRNRKPRTKPAPFSENLRFRKPGHPAVEEDENSDISDPKVRGFVRLGGLLRSRGRLFAAAFEYEKAAKEIGAPHPLIGLKLGKTYLDLGDASRAAQVLSAASEVYPDFAGLQSALGAAFLKKGDFGKAQAALETAVSQSPFEPGVHCGLSTLYEKSQHPRWRAASGACELLRSGF